MDESDSSGVPSKDLDLQINSKRKPIPTAQKNLAKKTFTNTQSALSSAKEKGEEAIRLATHDDLVPALWNKQGFLEASTVAASIALRGRTELTTIFIDADNMKRVNDRYGHDKGDEVIKEIASALLETFTSEGDVIARLSGDEFAIVVPRNGDENIKAKVEEARGLFEKTGKQIAPGSDVSFSFGVAGLREKIDGEFDRNKLERGELGITTIEASDPEPAYVAHSALQVAELRMYQDKNSRGMERSETSE